MALRWQPVSASAQPFPTRRRKPRGGCGGGQSVGLRAYGHEDARARWNREAKAADREARRWRAEAEAAEASRRDESGVDAWYGEEMDFEEDAMRLWEEQEAARVASVVQDVLSRPLPPEAAPEADVLSRPLPPEAAPEADFARLEVASPPPMKRARTEEA